MDMAENDQAIAPQGTEVDWKQRHDQLAQQYQQDMEKVYNVLTQQQQQQPPPQPQAPPQEPEWDVTDPKQLKQNVEGALRNTINTQLGPVMLQVVQNQFESHMLTAKRDERMPYFAHWENEIRQYAQGVQPGLLANYNTIVGLYQVVASQHANELVEIEVKKRLAQQQQQAQSDEVEVEDEPGEEPPGPAPAAAPPRQAVPPQQRPHPPAPSGAAASSVGVQTPRSQRTASVRRLTREEAYMAQQMGMSLKEYANAKDLGDYDL
jgi:hypothetical protein